MSILTKLFGYKIDPEVLHSYRTVIPDTLKFQYKLDGDGVYVITVTEIDGKPLDDKTLLVTQAGSKDEIVPAVHDLVMTYYEIPEELRPYYERDLTLDGKLRSNSQLVKA